MAEVHVPMVVRLTRQQFEEKLRSCGSRDELVSLLHMAYKPFACEDERTHLHTSLELYMSYLNLDRRDFTIVETARTLFARLCGSLAIRIPTTQQSWMTLRQDEERLIESVLTVLSGGFVLLNGSDYEPIRKFLERLWRAEMSFAPHRFSHEKLYRAMMHFGMWEFLEKHHCVDAVPWIMCFFEDLHAIEPVRSEWGSWSFFPWRELPSSLYHLGATENFADELETTKGMLLHDPARFWGDIQRFLVVAGLQANVPHHTLSHLISRAVYFRDFLERYRNSDIANAFTYTQV